MQQHLKTARTLGQKHGAHDLGYYTALEKIANVGLFKGIRQIAGKAWKGLAPGAQGLAKRMGAGGLAGGVGGAIAGGEQHPLLGAVLGAGGGALGGAAIGRGLQNRATKNLANTLFEGASQLPSGRTIPSANVVMKRMENLKPVYRQAERHLQSRLLPGIM